MLHSCFCASVLTHDLQKKAAEKKEAESTKAAIVQVDDLLFFRQFSKKTADDAIDVSAIIPTGAQPRVKANWHIPSMTRMSGGLPGQENCGKISFPTSVAFLSSQVHFLDLTSNQLPQFHHVPGFSDPIYAEAYVKMHGFDIMLGWSSISFLHS
jgi:coatomer subunit beta